MNISEMSGMPLSQPMHNEVPEGKEMEKGVEKNIQRNNFEKLPKFIDENNNLYIEDVQQTPNMINTRRSTNRQITVKMLRS